MRNAILVLALAVPRPASAGPIGGDVPLDGFHPALDARGFVTVDGGEVLASGEPSFGLVTSWAHGLGPDVQDLVAPTLVAAIGAPHGIELAAALPFGVIAADRDRGAQGVGDLAISAKLRVVDTPRWAIAGVVGVTLPTATSDVWLGSGAAGAGARAIVEWRDGRLRLAGNLGVRVPTRDSTYVDPTTGMQLALGASIPAGAAASWALTPGKLDALAELGAQLPLDGDVRPIEATVALRVRLAVASHFTIGAGTGLGDGAGNPRLRAFAAIVFEPHAARITRTVIADQPPPPPPPPPAAPAPPPEDPDRDHDGIPNVDDLCEDDPEDFDGIQDDDGCPEADADHDGIADADDPCPLDPDNTCKNDRVVVGDGSIAYFQEIRFAFDSAQIDPGSDHILDVIAAAILANPDITLIEIAGHTDSRGAADYNLDLSQRRAESVRDYLIDAGVDAGRLTARGYGETQPLMRGNNERAWRVNRRVELLIRKRGT